MKALILPLVLIASFSAKAKIENSQLEERHQALIEQAITTKCAFGRGFIKEVSTVADAIRVDQGITDYKYETKLEVHVRLDQYIFDIYDVTVKSSFWDMYDHNTKNWGVYEIDEVSNCIMR